MLPELYRRHGPVVDFGYGSGRMILVFGAEANEHVLSTAADAFEWGEAMQALVAVDGPTALVVSDGEDHRRRRRLVQPAFRSSGSTPTSAWSSTRSTARSATWQPGANIDASASLRDAVRRIVVRALFGEELGSEADRFGDLLEPGLRYIQRMPQGRFEHDLRVNPYARVQRSNRAADELVLAEVARRRAAGIDADAQPDTLTALLAGVDGEALTDAELLDQVRSLHGGRLRHDGRRRQLARARAGSAARRRWRPCGPRSTPSSATGRPPSTTCAPCPSPSAPCRRCSGCGRPGPRRPGCRSPRARCTAWRSRPAGSCSTAPTSAAAIPTCGRTPSASTLPAGRPAPPTRCRTPSCPSAAGGRRCIGFALATLELQVMAVRLAQQVEWRPRTTQVRPTGIATLTPKGGVPVEVTGRRR